MTIPSVISTIAICKCFLYLSSVGSQVEAVHKESGKQLPLKDYVSEFDYEEEESLSKAVAMKAEVIFNNLHWTVTEVVFGDSNLTLLLPTTVHLKALQDLPGHCGSGYQGDSSGLAIVVEINLPVRLTFDLYFTSFT